MEAKKVLFITTEIEPFVPENKTSLKGRLLPQTIQELGHEIRTFSPKWGNINERRNQLHEVIRLSGMNLIIDDTDHPLIIKVATLSASKMQVYFIDNDDYFMKRGILTDKRRWYRHDRGAEGLQILRIDRDRRRELRDSDEPSFRDAKVVMEVSSKEFERDLGAENAKFVEYKDAHYADIKDICDEAYGHTELEKIGVKFADGVIVESKDVDPSIIEYAKSLGLPVLDPVEGDAFNEAYNAFYSKIYTEC